MNRSRQNRTEEKRTEQSRTEQNRTEQIFHFDRYTVYNVCKVYIFCRLLQEQDHFVNLSVKSTSAVLVLHWIKSICPWLTTSQNVLPFSYIIILTTSRLLDENIQNYTCHIVNSTNYWLNKKYKNIDELYWMPRKLVFIEAWPIKL